MGRSVWHVPHRRNGFFKGREAILDELREQLTQRGRAALAQAITGLGGIGKTQTAVEYAYRHRDEYRAVLWLNAESSLDLKAGCSEIARRMKLPFPEDDLDQAVLAFRRWLEDQPDWLLILDNADDPAALESFLSHTEHGHILITSRAQDFQNLGILNPTELPQLSVEDAAAFLLQRCGREEAEPEERDAAEELARELDGLPLALEQAAAYIVASRGAAFRSYLEDYRHRGLGRLEARGPALGQYPRSVVTTWAANFDAVQAESPAAADVLRFSAFLAPDAIPFELLARGAPELGPHVQEALAESEGVLLLVNDLLQPLGCFSLVSINGQDETYTIHRLVQEVIKTAMDEPTRREWAERAVRAVNLAFPNVEHGTWPLCERQLSHALAVADLIERSGMETAEAGLLLNQVAFYLFERGQYTKAEPLYLQAMEIRRTALSESHPSYATSLNNLAGLYRTMGHYDKAELRFRQAMEIRRTVLGEKHPDYATSLNNLAGLYRTMGRYAEAEPLYRQAIEIRRPAPDGDPTEYAAFLNNLAELYRAMGRYTDAEPLYLQAMEIHHTVLREDHPSYADSLNNLAELYWIMGRYTDAESLYRQAMEIRHTVLGEKHPNYADSLSNLAELYREMAHHTGAEPLYRQAVSILRNSLGTSHPTYQAVLTNYVANQRRGNLPPP